MEEQLIQLIDEENFVDFKKLFKILKKYSKMERKLRVF